MNKEQTTKRIQEIESELAKLREDLNKPEQIEDFQVGDVFGYHEGHSTRVLILNSGYESGRYVFGYNYKEALRLYCDFSVSNGATKEEMLEKLNNNRSKFIRNISKDLSNLVAA